MTMRFLQRFTFSPLLLSNRGENVNLHNHCYNIDVQSLILPHFVGFLGPGGDFIGYLLGGEFNVVHEGLLSLVSADVHHLDDVVFMAQIHVGDSGTSSGVARHAFEARQ